MTRNALKVCGVLLFVLTGCDRAHLFVRLDPPVESVSRDAEVVDLGSVLDAGTVAMVAAADLDAATVDATHEDAMIVDASVVDAPEVDAANVDASNVDAALVDAAMADATQADASCSAGYVPDLDGSRCFDVDECAVNNGGCSQLCINTPGAFRCDCNNGYTLDSDHISCDLNPTCDHRWVASTNARNGYKLMGTASGLVVGGEASDGTGQRLTLFRNTDGVVQWSNAGEGGFPAAAGSNNLVVAITGDSRSYHVESAATGAVLGTISYAFPSGLSTPPSTGVSPNGDSLTVLRSSSSGPWTDYLGSLIESGTGPANVLAHQNATGHVVDVYQNAALEFSTPTGLPDGTWILAARNITSTTASISTYEIPAGTSALLTLDQHLNVLNSVALAAPYDANERISVSNSGMRITELDGVSGYDDAGQVWSRPDCPSNFSPSVVGDHVIVPFVVDAVRSACGVHFERGSEGLAIATLDAATGETIGVRWFSLPLANQPNAFTVGADGTEYASFVLPPRTSLNLCDETPASFPFGGSVLVAF